jgi:hypothetical protein
MSGRQSAMGGRQSAMDNYVSPTAESPNAQFGAELPRSHTSFSDAPTLVRSHSNASHSSIAKPKPAHIGNGNGSSSSGEQPMIRSIFPRYNPEVPLERQSYYPTQASPTHIPRQVISKPQYSSSINSAMQSPGSPPPTVGRYQRGITEVPKAPSPSTNEELKELWKVTNGWRVSASEGRSFCMKMDSAIDTPIHTLSSSTQAFYALSMIPTSTSALLTMTRQDPNKPPPKRLSSLKVGASDKLPGNEVLTTTLEEVVRRHAPNDGLVALLYPKAAANMAIDLASKPNGDGEAIIEAAERECGRLVWDDDSAHYYLVHPAISTPFIVNITSSPAWSRVEYTLEHPELPRNIVTLTREGGSGGYLQVDTGIAARIDCFYIVDVAICAILVVALSEEQLHNVERFEAPPMLAPDAPMSPKAGSIFPKLGKKEGKKNANKIEEMELDLESQSSIGDKDKDKKKKSKLPAPTRGVLWFLYLMFRFVVWILEITVKTAAAIIIGISKCLTSKENL